VEASIPPPEAAISAWAPVTKSPGGSWTIIKVMTEMMIKVGIIPKKRFIIYEIIAYLLIILLLPQAAQKIILGQ